MAEHELRLPKFGMQMTEATVEAWLVSDGDSVSEGQEIVTVSTDKVDSDLESPAAGSLKIAVAAGETVAVGTLLGVISS